ADKISMEGGTLLYSDEAFPYAEGVPRKTVKALATEVSGVLLTRLDITTAFDVLGRLQPDDADTLHFSGVISPETTGATLRIVTTHLRLPNLAARFLPPKSGH